MGCGESAIEFGDDIEERADDLPNHFTREQFQKRRTSVDQADTLQSLEAIATNLNGKEPSDVTDDDKVCFICCNTYTKPRLALGVGPLNDALTVAENHVTRGFTVFFLHNPTIDLFMKFLPHFLKSVKTALTVFYTGHGASIRDTNGDESDGLDEVMVFDTGYIVDDRLLETLKECANGSARVFLLSDCCHSGSIWDLQSAIANNQTLPANLLSLASAADSQTAKQTTVNHMSQGIFSYYLWKALHDKPKATPNDLVRSISSNLKRFNQKVVAVASTPGMLIEPLFP
jgi:hypothetical protein